MGDYAAARRCGELAGEGHRVAFNGDVEVEGRTVEEEVAEGAADEVGRQAATAGEADDLVE